METMVGVRKPRRRYTVALFAVTTLGAVTVLTLVGAQAIQDMRSAAWPHVAGTVSNSFVHERCAWKSREVNAIVEYQYHVGQVALLGRHVEECASRDEARHVVEGHAPGGSVNVYFDSAAPATSRLKIGLARNHLLNLTAGALFFVISAFAFVRELRLHLRKDR